MPQNSTFSAWMMCSRPKTWPIALSPVIVGLSVAYFGHGSCNAMVAIATALLSVLMQAISNMENDAAYTRRKAERSNRKGLPRATALGLLSVETVEKAIKALAGIAAIDTLYLMYVGGWWFVLVTVASSCAAYCYMGGPKPLAYTAWSEFVCFVFFGVVAGCGTYWLQVGQLSWICVLCSCAVGFLATAVLVVNNFRDWEHDKSIGRYTLAVCLGEKRTLFLYDALIIGSYLCLFATCFMQPILIVASLIVLVNGLRVPKLLKSIKENRGNELNAVLFATVKHELCFALLTSAGMLCSSLIFRIC